MRIAYDHQIFCLQRYGGISRYFTELIPRIAAESDLEAWVWRGWAINRYPLAPGPGCRVEGWRRPAWPATNALALTVSEAVFRRRVRSYVPRIYHPTYYFGGGPLPDARFVVTVYDMIHELFPRPGRSYREIARCKRQQVAQADAVICISEHTKRDLMRLYDMPDDRLHVIPLANALHHEPGARPMPEPYLLYVGSRGGYKNFAAVLTACAEEPRITRDHMICCFGGGPFTHREQAEIEALGLAGRVRHWQGGDGELAALYAHATAFVCPSLYEGFGLPVLEAMHYGCPVIASDRASLPEVAGAAALYFDPEEEGALAATLLRLLDDGSLRRQLGADGRAREGTFSAARCARETAALYRSVGGLP